MVGFPNNPWCFPTKNDHLLGCEMGVITTILPETPKYRDALLNVFFFHNTVGDSEWVYPFLFFPKNYGALHAGAQRGQLRGCTMWRVLGMDSRCGGITDDSDRFFPWGKTGFFEGRILTKGARKFKE